MQWEGRCDTVEHHMQQSAEKGSTSAARSGDTAALEAPLSGGPPRLARRKSSLPADTPRCAAPRAVVKSAPACRRPHMSFSGVC